MPNLAAKYRPKKFDEIVEQNLVVQMVKNLVEDPHMEVRNFLFTGPAGTGKANTLDTEILTFDGYVKMRDIKVGDRVFTHSGSIGQVSGIYPQGVKPIYRITLQDRTYIDVSDEHLNLVYRYNEDKKKREDFCLTTKDLIKLFKKSRFKLRVDIPTVDWNHKDVPVDPYLLGALIGDGSLHDNFAFSNSEPDIVSKVNFILNRDFDMSLSKLQGDNVDYSIITNFDTTHKYNISYKGKIYTSASDVIEILYQEGYPHMDITTVIKLCQNESCRASRCYPELSDNLNLLSVNPMYRMNPLLIELKNMGLCVKSKDKFIPKNYLYNDRESRLELLRGLFDTDGYTDPRGVTDWTTTSKQLSDDFAFLVRSLGIRDTVSEYPASYRTPDGDMKVCGMAYTHNLKIPNDLIYCSSNKHMIRRKIRQNNPLRNIVSIDYIGDQECQCIMINHDDHSYICNLGMIPTHNTTLARCIANVLNEGKGDPIEIDAASNSGVDNMRQIIDQARSYPVGSNWKIFIIDECFQGDSLIRTTSGIKQIRDVQIGDQVYNLTGKAYVKNKYCNKVNFNNLIFVTVSGKKILTTKSHLFFTDDGWVEAQNLIKGDTVYDYKTMCNLRERIQDLPQRQSHDLRKGVWRSLEKGTSQDISQELYSQILDKDLSHMRKNISDISFCRCKNLFSKVWSRIHEASRTYTEAERSYIFSQSRIYLSNLWEAYDDTEQRPSKDVQRALWSYLSAADECEEEVRESCATYILCDMWKYVCTEIQGDNNMLSSLHWETFRDASEREKISRVFNSHEASQSYGESRMSRESSSNKDAQRYFASAVCSAWRKRELYQASDSFEGSFRNPVGVRISCQNRYQEKRQPDAISYELQTRPCLSFDPVRSRGGWDRAQYEGAAVSRRKESNLPRKFRVESVEVYQSGNNDGLFRSCFKDSEIHGNYVDMYDLEVDGHPSYFVEDILVHNCHAFSNSAWQAALKTFEEVPARTIFLMATTNPEKIPATIISRVQQFQLSKISLNGIEERLKYIIEKENEDGQNINYDDDAISYIAKMANGGMRDGITLLEKAIASDKHITSVSLMSSLGLPNYDTMFSLLQAYASKNNSTIADIIDSVYNSGTNFTKWMIDFHAFISNVTKYILLKDIRRTMIPSHYESKISKYGNAHLMICQKLASKLVKLNQELRFSQYQQEITLTYLCSVVKK